MDGEANRGEPDENTDVGDEDVPVLMRRKERGAGREV